MDLVSTLLGGSGGGGAISPANNMGSQSGVSFGSGGSANSGNSGMVWIVAGIGAGLLLLLLVLRK